MDEEKNKVLVIGLDGASPYPLFSYAKKGYLKNIQKLMLSGAYGELESTIPPATCPAWVSSVTGVNPGKHGIHDFILDVDLKNRNFIFANSHKRKIKAIWNILSEAGKKVIIINVPVTYPPEKVNGIIVSGLFTPSLNSKFTYPTNIREELHKNKYQIDIGETIIRRSLIDYENKHKEIEELINLIEKRIIACELLNRKYDWDFYMVVFVALDRLHHFFWKYIDNNQIGYDSHEAEDVFPLILKVYNKIDEAVGRLVDCVDDDVNIMIYSDHGFKPLNKYLFTNSVFREKNLLHINKRLLNNVLNQHYVVNKMINYGLHNFLRIIPTKLRRKFTMALQPSKDYIDVFNLPEETLAFQVGNGFININLDEKSQEYEKIKTKIIHFFNTELKNGELIKAYKREEVYHGPFINTIPDIVLQVKYDVFPTQYIPIKNLQIMEYNNKSIIPSLRWSGQHDTKGVIICNGSNFPKNTEIKDAHIIDIAPTILNVLGESIPKYFDGKVIEYTNIVSQK